MRMNPDFAPRRAAILKGATEVENIGDVMMQHGANMLIRSLGFETIHKVGHGEATAEVAALADSIGAIFVLGSIQYSDAWPSPTLLERLERSIRFHRHFPKARVVFLPSTWGPFEPWHRDALALLLTGATVFARDTASVRNINSVLDFPVAEYCPDLAFAYPTADPHSARALLARTLEDPVKPLLGIIPNQRCVEPGVTPLRHPEAYVAFLARARDFAIRRGFNVACISHMLNTDRDLALVRDLNIECIATDDITLTRAVMANLTLCVCSRYHGLISCLSHGIPTLALGWHHKYRNLMEDMGLGAHHLSVRDLPRDPGPLLHTLYRDRREVRHSIEHNVTAARGVITTRTEGLGTA